MKIKNWGFITYSFPIQFPIQSCQKSAKTGRFGLGSYCSECSYKKESNERKKTDSLYFGNLA